MDIHLRYTTIDHYGESRRYRSLDGAQRYAREKMGNIFDISEMTNSVISSAGVAKITVSGITAKQLMGETCPNCDGKGMKKYLGEPGREACRFCGGRGFYNPTSGN